MEPERLATPIQSSLFSDMHTVKEIEEQVKRLPVAEQKVLLSKILGLIANGNASKPVAQDNLLTRSFAEWDASHCVTVGEKPTRERTYAGNPRLH
jgi:hypothetical protein